MKRIITALLSALALTSCMEGEIEQKPFIPVGEAEQSEDGRLTVGVRIRDETDIDTKSILKDDDIEDRITGITLAAYDRDGVLRDRKHFTSGFSSMSLDVVKSNTFDIYALANMGDMTGELPAREADIGMLCFRITSYGDFASSGIPMCGTLENQEGGEDIRMMELERLFAKISVRILHDGLLNSSSEQVYAYNLCNRSLYLRQANSRLYPFSSVGSRALSASDTMSESDYHADLDNRSEYDGSLSQSQLGPGPGFFQDTTLVFYVPENVQGQLLPGNDDPFAKTPEHISSLNGQDYSSICTYLEFNAKRMNTGIGYGGGVTYRYYLGADSTTDFSIERNCRYNLTLKFTEEGFFVDSWKMSRNEDWQDTRTLRFVDKPCTIYIGDTKNVMVHYHTGTSTVTSSMLKPDEWTYSFDDQAMEAAGLTYTIDKNTLVNGPNGYDDFCFGFTASSQAKAGASFPLKISTWDGGISDYTTMTVVELGSMSVSWDFCPMYVAQEGVLSISGVPDDKMPLSISGYDGKILKVSKESETTFKVIALAPGETTLSISNRDGSQTQELTLVIQAPLLRMKASSMSVNPDGASVRTGYFYIDRTGSELGHLNGQAFENGLKAAAKDAPSWLSVNSTSSEIEFHVSRLKDGEGNAIETGKEYYINLGASGCDEVEPVQLRIHLTDPFAGIRSGQDYGKIDDCSLSTLSSVNSRIKTYFAETVQDNRSIQFEAPIPNADASQVSAEIVPFKEGTFSYGCEAFGIRWGKSTSFASGAAFSIEQQEITADTRHSAGIHNIYVTVTNRHSDESISKICGTIDIYVHIAVGAKAVFGHRNGSYNQNPAYGTFASVYNKLLGNPIFSDSDLYIYYMDVSAEYLVPASGILIFDRMMAGTQSSNNYFNCLDIVLPSIEDGATDGGMLLISVFDNKSGDRTIVAEEPFGYRRGIGQMLYRALLMQGRESALSESDLKKLMIGYNPLGSNNENLAPKYGVHDMCRNSNPASNTVTRKAPFHFSPVDFKNYRDENGNGYHVIHFLDTIAPDSCGWTNLL
ncbi:MAG: hypothetical protein ACI3ZL_01820 [Candidatus Cryptobacteroides sp.]